MKEKSLEIYVAVHRFYKHEITPQSMKYLYMYCKLELRNKIIDFFFVIEAFTMGERRNEYEMIK